MLQLLQPNGRQMPLDEETGIDVLGNLMESSTISINRPYYGDLHNMGHVFIGYCHDPDHRHLVNTVFLFFFVFVYKNKVRNYSFNYYIFSCFDRSLLSRLMANLALSDSRFIGRNLNTIGTLNHEIEVPFVLYNDLPTLKTERLINSDITTRLISSLRKNCNICE